MSLWWSTGRRILQERYRQYFLLSQWRTVWTESWPATDNKFQFLEAVNVTLLGNKSLHVWLNSGSWDDFTKDFSGGSQRPLPGSLWEAKGDDRDTKGKRWGRNRGRWEHKPRNAWSHQKLEEEREDSALGGNPGLPTTWFETSGFQICRTINLCCFKPHSLYLLVTPASGKYRLQDF